MHLDNPVRMVRTARLRLALDALAKLRPAMLATIYPHQSIVPCRAAALNSGVMPALIDREADSAPEYKMSPAPLAARPMTSARTKPSATGNARRRGF